MFVGSSMLTPTTPGLVQKRTSREWFLGLGLGLGLGLELGLGC